MLARKLPKAIFAVVSATCFPIPREIMSNIAEKIVLDLETKKSFDEVQGRKPELMGISVAGIYSYKNDQFKVIAEKDIKQLLPYLEQAELVIGFNIKRFDFVVLQPYLNFDLKRLNCLDMFEEVQKALGFRLGLNSIAQATLEIGKTGSGLDALKYFRQGNLDKLSEYCQHDVFITREIYEYGRKYGHLLYHRGLRLERIPVVWGENQGVDQLLQEAFNRHTTLEIEYSSSATNSNRRHSRKIDIYHFDLGRIIAYCHLRRAMRTFNAKRILSARLTNDRYEIPTNFNLQQFKAQQNSFNSIK